MNDLLVRAKTAIALLVVLSLVFVYASAKVLFVLSIFIWFFSCYEFSKVYKTVIAYSHWLMLANVIFFLINPYWSLVIYLACLAIFIAIIDMLFFCKGTKFLSGLANLVLGFLFIDAAFYSAYIIYDNYGLANLLGFWVLVAVIDASAYFCGKAFGRNKLMPKVSPKKTWEGLLGAVLTLALIVFTVIGDNSWLSCGVFLFCMLLGGVFGDLWYSYNKRLLGVKDFANLLPGHGGLLDRLDGVIFTFPLLVAHGKIFAKYTLVS